MPNVEWPFKFSPPYEEDIISSLPGRLKRDPVVVFKVVHKSQDGGLNDYALVTGKSLELLGITEKYNTSFDDYNWVLLPDDITLEQYQSISKSLVIQTNY